MNKQGELLTGSKRRSPGERIISTLLVLCMLFGLLPASVLAADTMVSSGAASAGSDAFGIATKGDLSTEEKKEEAKSNPYGTENWFNLFPVSELHIASGDSSGRSFDTHNYNVDGKTGSIGDAATGDTSIGYKKENQGNDGFRMMDTAGCDALGEGQKRYVATIAFWEGGNTIQLFLADKDGNRISNELKIGNKNTVEYLEAVEAHQTTGFLSVACGDFDGDGKDSIVAYFPEMEDGNPYICSYSIAQKDDGSFELTVGAAVESRLWGMLETADLSAKNSKNSKVRNNTPLVQLVADDADKDGVDELVVTTSISSTSANDVNNRGSRLFVYDYCANKSKEPTTYSWNRSASMVLQAEGNAWAAGRLRWASSSVGNVIQNTGGGADFPEIVSAGYYDHAEKTSTGISSDSSKENLAVYIASCTKVTTDENGNQIGSYAKTATNMTIKASEFVRGGLYTGDDVQSLVPVQAFAARGVNDAEYILVADTVYSYENGALSEKYREGYFNDDDDGIGACVITNGIVQDVTAGNFDGNINGVEQVLFTTMQKRSGRNDYFSKIYTYQLKNSFDSSGNPEGTESWQKDETGYLTDCTGYAYLSLCAFDCDRDGTIVKYKEASRTYTDPEVLALLEATPYFSEKDGGDIGNSATSYGTSKESGGSSSYSNSLTTNVVAGFEWGVDDITAGFACGAGFEATVENNFTWSTEEEQYESYSLTYSNDTGDNMVIVYRRPVITYCYEEKYSGKLHTVSKEGTLATSMIPVDRYNEIAAQNGMDLISDSVLSTPGDPFSYRSTLPEGAVTKDSDKQQYNGKGTVEQSFTKGSTTTHSYEYELNTSFNAYGLVFGVKAGGGAGYAHTESTSTMNTTEITKAGAVTCNGTEEYDFQWQFAYWDTMVNGNRVPVLGYVVKDPVAPPSPPSNLYADNPAADSFNLHWKAGSRPADEYRIYRVLDDTNAEPVQVATVDGTKTDCTLSSLRADTTYTYIVKAYAAAGEGISSRGLSVASESLTITTPPEDAEAPTITGPDNVGVRVGETASFTVNVVLPDKYGSVSYQWQQRKNASGWSKVSDSSIGKTLKLTNVTEEMDGTEYRCALTASYADGSPTYYYSGVGKLTVGRTSVSAALDITQAINGDGSIAVPYTGAANYQMQNGTETKTVLVEQPVTIAKKDSIPELTVYQVNESNPTAYVGIGTADGKTVYYGVTKSGEAYEVGAQLTLTQYEYLKIDKSAYVTMPIFDSTKPVSKTVEVAEKGKVTYLLMATVTGGTTNPPITIPEGSKVEGFTAKDTRLTGFDKSPTLTLHWYNGGKNYAYDNGNVGAAETGVTGAYDVYQNGTGAYVLGRSETYTVESTEGTKTIYEDEIGYWFYHVTMSQPENSVTCVQQSAKEALSNGVSLSQLTAFTKKVKTTVESPVYTTKSGTNLNLKATVTDSTALASDATVDFRIVNTSTGATATVTATTNNSGIATATWTAPATGLYSVRAVVQDAGGYAGTESAAQYYYAGATAPSENDTIKEYQLTLKSGSTPLVGEMDYAADSVISIATLSRTVKKDITGDWKPITEGIVYTVTAPNGKTSTLSAATFELPRAGAFSIKAYAGTVATENLLAAVTLQVRRVSVTVKPIWLEGTIPNSLSEISKSVSGATINSDLLDKVFKASCDLYGSGGSLISEKSGRYTVSLAYQNNDEAKNFTNCYSVNLQSDVLIVLPNSANVYYEWGENGTMQGRYGENHYTMSSGRSTIAGTELQFTAMPNAGYQVEQWIINGTAMNKTALASKGYMLSGNTLTISSFSIENDTDATKDSLTVQVTFASSKNEITFSVTGDGGTLSATNSSGAALTTGNSVALGATVTFTAAPATNKVVKEWLVDGKIYTWQGTAEPYRGNTLRLENISASHAVYVSFQNGESYTVTTSVYNEAGNAQSTLAAITAKNAETGLAVDLTKPISSGTAMTFTATLTSPTTSTVKEWQYKTGTGSFVTVAGSGGQGSFTFYNLSSNTEVRAIVTSAQSFQLDFGIQLGGKPCTDNTIASLSAKSNGTPVTAGSQPAYIPVDFALTLNDKYRVVEWSNNVTANVADNRSASLASLLSTTGNITVTIEEKPQVNVTADKNGTTTVISTLMANNTQTIGEGETKHVEKGSAIAVTATPDTGWYVDSITIGSEKVFDEAATNYVFGAKTVRKSNITADTTVTVVYAQKPTVTISAGSNIAVTTQTDITAGYVEKYSDPITFTATPATGYETDSWTVNNKTVFPQATASDETTYTYPTGVLKVTENITVAVTGKAIPRHDISYAVVDTKNTTDGGDGFNGKVSLTASRKNMNAYNVAGEAATNATSIEKPIYRDSTVTLTATANEGYRVKHWLVGGEIYTENSVTYSGKDLKLENLSEAKTVQVEFEKSTDQTIISATKGGSIVSAKVGATPVNVNGFKLSNNATVDIVAAADDGYELVGWMVNNEMQEDAKSLSFSFTSNSSSTGSAIVAVFASDSYAVTYEMTGENGTLAADFGASGTLVKGGTAVTFTASPAENYAVKSWTVNGAPQMETSNQLTLPITKATHVTVEFAQSRYVVTFDETAISATVGGQTISSGAAVAKGSDVAFTAQLTGTNIVKNWATNSVSDGGTTAAPSEQTVYTLKNLGADTTVSVETMENPSYEISYSAGAHGSISITDDQQATSPVTALRHSKLTFAAAPEAYYQVDAWMVGGTVVTGANAESLGVTLTAGKDGVSLLTVNDLTAGMTITVSFKEAVRYNVKFSADTKQASGTIAATANDEAIINTGIDLIGGSTLVFTATPTYSGDTNNATMVYHWTVNGKPVENNLSNQLELTLAETTNVMVAFENYVGYAIPVSQTGYVISDVNRTPSDTKPTTQIRKGGTVSFKVSPDGEFNYAAITKLTVSGYDCLTGTGNYDKNADKVAAVRNADGSYTVTVTGVKGDITTEIEARKLVVGGITVPEELKENEDLNTKEELQTKLNVQLTGVGKDNRAYYDIALKYWTGTEWNNVKAENFPASGVDVLLGYPTGTDKTNTFTIVHMFTTDSDTHKAGDTEVISNYQRTDEGILFHVSSLSPFALGWAASGGNPGGGGDDGGDGGNPGGGGGGSVAASYTLTFETNGGSKIKSAGAEAGTVIELAGYSPVREGYSFVGWYSDAALTQKITTVTLKKSLTIYAKWTKGSGVREYLNTDDHIAYLSGYGTGEFGADSNMTRAEVAVMFYRLLKDQNAGDAKSFPDVGSAAWYSAAVEKLSGLGIISGYSDGSFQPENTITRAEFVAIASRFAAITDADCSFSDLPKTHWAYAYIAFASNQGWISGYSDGTFGPSKNITRAEVTKIVNSMLGRQPDETYIGSHSVKSFTDLVKTHWAYYEIMEAANAHAYTKSDDGHENWSALK